MEVYVVIRKVNGTISVLGVYDDEERADERVILEKALLDTGAVWYQESEFFRADEGWDF